MRTLAVIAVFLLCSGFVTKDSVRYEANKAAQEAILNYDKQSRFDAMTMERRIDKRIDMLWYLIFGGGAVGGVGGSIAGYRAYKRGTA